MGDSRLRTRFIKPSMDPKKLQHFLAVYDLRHFGRAATDNGVTQQAISKSVKKLEEQLGVELFERGPYGPAPTIFAHSLARRAKVILSEARLAAAELSALRGAEEGYVRAGFGWSFVSRIAPQTVLRYRRRRPNIKVSLSTGSSDKLFDRLLNGEVEFVASCPLPDFAVDPLLEAETLFGDVDVIVMRHDHPLAHKPDVTLADLSEQTWATSGTLGERWRKICATFLAAGVEPPANTIDMDSVGIAKAMIAQSDCVALLSTELVINETMAGQFHTLRRTEFPSARTAMLVTRRSSALQPAAQALIHDLLEVTSALRPGTPEL
ncbi:MAG: LysR family transcriptional regulator [Parasphingopyxis sp.]|uniref:LysR family transcriptional regulator n=1 Tax=Parasphingopyxis sp. TaxID=1920299 RepID=UPI003F9FEE9B